MTDLLYPSPIGRLPDRMATPSVARAMLSPTGLLLAGAGAAVGILAGGGIVGAVALGLVGWGGRVAAAFLRRPRKERIDPFTLQDPWRRMVNKAQWTARHFDDAVRQTKPGPLRDRLTDVGGRVQQAVEEAWAIAQRGHALDKAVRALDVPRIRSQLAAAEERGDEAIVGSVRSQLESAERLGAVAADARTRLERLNAQLDETVARAVELSLSAADVGALQPLGTDVENVVIELESLRLALEETT